MNRSAFLAVFSTCQLKRSYSSCNTEKSKECRKNWWESVRLGQNKAGRELWHGCTTHRWWETAGQPFLTFPTEIQRTMTFPLHSPRTFVSGSISPVQCSAVADPEVGELHYLLLTPTVVMRLVPVHDHRLGQHCTAIRSAAQILPLPAKQSLVCTICMYSPYHDKSLIFHGCFFLAQTLW